MGLGGVPKRTRIERVERRYVKQRTWDVEWAEEDDYGRWDALMALLRKSRGRASVAACKFHVRFGASKPQ